MVFWVEDKGAQIGKGILLLFQVDFLIQYLSWVQILDTFILGIELGSGL